MPIKTGKAKITHHTYTMIHYYDLNPIINQINILHERTTNITSYLNTTTEYKSYSNRTKNSAEILRFIRERVERKLGEIVLQPQRKKRGLINVLGSAFKAISGNLDASDGERYDNTIKQLETNQRILQMEMASQGSLSNSVIKKFNNTVQQLYRNDKLIEDKINQIQPYLKEIAYGRNYAIFKELNDEFINMYEIIDSILQDVENSLVFSRLKIMHPSIITNKELYIELRNLQEKLGESQLALQVTTNNTLLFEKIINLECFIFNNRITHILHVPIVHTPSFNYYHLYSVPTYARSLFKVVIPQGKFLSINQLHYAYYEEGCQKIMPDLHLCPRKELQTIQEDAPCEIKLLNHNKDASTCRQTEVKIIEPVLNQLDRTNQWILICPKKETIQMFCPEVQDERRKLIGTFLCKIPPGCRMVVKTQTATNEVKVMKPTSEPVLFPDLTTDEITLPILNLSLHLPDLKLDDLYKLREKVFELNEQQILTFEEVAKYPSFWTIFVYILIAICCFIAVWRKMLRPRLKRSNRGTNDVREDIQLPRQA